MAGTADLKNQVSRLKDVFRDFRDNREEYEKVIWRRRPTSLSPSLQYGGDQYQSPDPEATIMEHVDVLMMNPTQLDAAPLDKNQTETNKENAQDIAKAIAIAWDQMNPGRWWDAAVGTGQVKDGVAVMRLCWYPQDPSYRGDVKDRKWPFYWHKCHILGVGWMPPDPDSGSSEAVWYEYERDLVEIQKEVRRTSNGDRGASGRYIKDGELVMPALTKEKKLYWMLADQPIDKASTTNAKVTVVVRDARDPEADKCPVCSEGSHPSHTITEWIKGPGDAYDAMSEVGTYNSPFPGNSFFIIAGREMPNEENPHYRYRPLVMPLLVETVWLNHLETILAAMTQHDYEDENVYIDLSKVPAWVQLPEGGKDVTQVFTKPKPGSGQIMGVPGQIYAWPTSISPHLVTLRQECLARMDRYRPNRFVTGQAFSEARYATGTSFLEASQQAKLPYNRLLSQSDQAIKRALEYCFHAIRRWDAVYDNSEDQRKYYLVASGNENLMYTEAKRGELIYLDANKLNLDFQIQLETSNDSLAEQIQSEQMAWINYEKGGYDEEQLLKRLGFKDPIAQKRRLRKTQLRAAMQPALQQAQLGLVAMRMALIANIHLPMPFSQQGIAQPPGVGTPPNPQGAPGVPQTRTERLGQPAIAPPAMPGPTGGASGVATGP